MGLIRLEAWAILRYPDKPPSIVTLRKWARNGNIYPAPELHGREYRVSPEAFYIKPEKASLKLKMENPRARTGKKSKLMESLLREEETLRRQAAP